MGMSPTDPASSDQEGVDPMSPSAQSIPDMAVRDISQQILQITTEYSLDKFYDSKDRLVAGTPKFLSVIDRFVEAQEPVETCLPSFPFKSANQVYKVFGTLPDKAEELALERLNTMCVRIQEVYPPGARVTIISDGITYNDLLSISDRDTWAYGEALRKLSARKSFDHITFSRIKDLLDFPLPEELREITYVANCTNFRRILLNKYGKDDLDIDNEIATNPDTKLTYLGYRRFLESDLKHIFPPSQERTKNGYKRDVKFLAKQMLIRGYAFAHAVKDRYPNYLRLSIHESLGENKISISLLSTKTGYTTPWHCSVARLNDGTWISAPMSEFNNDSRLRIVYEDDRASHFEEKPNGPNTPNSYSSWESYLQAPRQLCLSSSGYSSPSSSSSRSEKLSTTTSPNTTELCTENSSLSSPMLHNKDCFEEGTCLGLQSSSPDEPAAADADKPAFGRRLIPQIMDSLAVTDPNRTVFSLAKYSNHALKYQDISAQAFTSAVNKTAWWLTDQLGEPTTIQPLGYIGPHDLRHILLTHAAVKAGYAAVFLSPKNSTEGALAVLEAVKCHVWVSPGNGTGIGLVKDLLEQRPMKVLELPSLETLLSAETCQPFPYTKTFEEAKNDPFCFLHTSGSTGVPKPIPWTHALIGTMDAVRLLPPADGDDGLLPWTSDWKDGDKIYSSFPMSHGAGIIMDILMPALFNLVCILGPVGVLPNIGLIEALANNAQIDIWSMVPSLVDELGECPDVLKKLARSKFICASGGPVSPVSAGKVNDVVRVLNLTGTTEGLFIGNLVVTREDWHWFAFHPYSGFEFKEVEPDTYEHWVHRNQHWELFQGIFQTFPERNSINFKDLYVRHPTKPNLWAFKGRSDDLVVLSNGYKISPLETESFVTTHPAITGCLVIGTGKPQAALLIELQDPSSKTDAVLNSIWATVQEANSQSRHKNQLLRDFITFSEPDKPFIRTDKGTIKRAATLALYKDYIERFYDSRSDDLANFTVDTTSLESTQSDLRDILASSLPAIQQASINDDLFELGLDSLGVFGAIKAIKAATGLKEQLAPRHLYANPTIALLSKVVAELVSAKIEACSRATSAEEAMKRMMAEYRSRQSFKLNSLDYVNPNHYMGLVFYFPLQDGVRFEQVFSNLQDGLNRTLDLIPALGGKMMNCSEQEIGYSRGDLCVTIPPLSMSGFAHNRLIYNDLSEKLPSFDVLREGGFVPSAFRDDAVLPDDPFPKMPADILVAQANFVKGGCVLAVNMNHCCLDGIGVMVALRAWAENCRYLQGDASATCEWYDPESFNHSLPEILHEQEGWTKELHNVHPHTWGILPFHAPERIQTLESRAAKSDLPPPPKYTLHTVWPLPRAERTLNTTVFEMSAESVRRLKNEVVSDPQTQHTAISISDIVQAFLWRSAIRARYHVAKSHNGKIFNASEMSILELPTDGRPYFSSQLPSTYMGSMLVMNRSSMSVETLCSSETSLAFIAHLLREGAARITPSAIHDAFTILQSLQDHSRFSTANMGLDHMHAMISNLMLFQTREISFGNAFFGNEGSPEMMRPQVERGNGRFRFLIISPMKRDGSVELVLGTFPEELEWLNQDDEFTKYAKFVDCSY